MDMLKHEFEALIEEFIKKQKNILTSKGQEYARSNDVLANFKRVAEDLHLNPLEVWSVYFRKHVDAIFHYCAKGYVSSDEGIEGRLLDASNYLLLLHALIKNLKQYEGKIPNHNDFNSNRTVSSEEFLSQPYDVNDKTNLTMLKHNQQSVKVF